MINVEELHCLNCNEELPEDNFYRHHGLVLTDEREQVLVSPAHLNSSLVS